MRKSSREGKSKGEVICWWDGMGETLNKEQGGDNTEERGRRITMVMSEKNHTINYLPQN